MEKKKSDYEPPVVKELDLPAGELSPEELAKVSGGTGDNDCANGVTASAVCQAGSGAAVKYPG